MCALIFCMRTIRSFFFFFNDTATTEIYTLSLHDALPIFVVREAVDQDRHKGRQARNGNIATGSVGVRSEEHTSELQSQSNLVCRLLLEKKKKKDPAPGESHPPQTARPSHRLVVHPDQSSV